MNADFVKSIGRLTPPKFSGGNSIAVSRLGLTAVLNGDGTIKLANLRKSSGEYVDLKVDNISALELKEFTNIEFDNDGALLLLWSAKRIGIIEISASILKADNVNILENDTSTFTFVCDDVNSGSGIEQAAIPIVKACFHPLNSRHVVVLSEREILRVVDVRSMETKQHRLSPDLRFSSFCFGPDIEWMKFALFLLTVKGDVFALCPLIPDGTLVSRQTVNDLWVWVEDHSCSGVETSGVSSTTRDAYVESVRGYLNRTLGPYKEEDDSLYVRAGEGHISDWEQEDFPLVSGFASNASNRRSVSTGSTDVSSHSLLLQGPLRVERGYREPSATSGPATPLSAANDICVPVVRGASENRGIAAPVLVISRGSGEVEFLLMDTQSSSGGFVGPGWRPIDRHLPHLGTSFPDLLLVETMQVDQLLPASSSAASASTTSSGKDIWKLTPDPVISHFFHVTNHAKSQSFLLSSSWLHSALREVDTLCDRATGSSSCALGPSEEASDLGADTPTSAPLSSTLGVAGAASANKSSASDLLEAEGREEEASYCIPVFIVNSETLIENKAVPVGSVAITGLAVISDPFLGHVALFRTSTGLVSAVNLTVHTKLCELQASLEQMSGTDELSTIKTELNKATSEESIRWRHSQQLLLKIATGLKNMPVIDNNAALTTQSSAQNKKFLVEAAEALERNVIVPMNELSQSTLFHYDMLKETLKSQMVILEGKGALSSTPQAPAAEGDYHLSQGLKSLLQKLTRDHDILVERVKAISAKLELQKQAAEAQLSLAVNQRAKLTRAEVLYNKQLKDWSTTIAQMSKHIETLKQLTKPAMKLSSSTLAGLTAVNGAGAAAPSSSSTTATPLKSFSSPAGAVLVTPPGTQQSVLYPGSTLGTYGGSGGARTNYNTPGKFTGGLRSVSGTPFGSGGVSSGSMAGDFATTPSKYLAGVSALDSPAPTGTKENSSESASNVTPVSATPVQQAPVATRQFFQSPGAGSYSNKLLSLQSPAVYRRVGTGPTGFRNQQTVAPSAAKSNASGAVDISTVGAAPPASGTPILNEGDQIACRELLGAQTELLKESEERLRALEERFKSLLNSAF